MKEMLRMEKWDFLCVCVCGYLEPISTSASPAAGAQ